MTGVMVPILINIPTIINVSICRGLPVTPRIAFADEIKIQPIAFSPVIQLLSTDIVYRPTSTHVPNV